MPAFDALGIEQDIARIVRGWGDELRQQLIDSHGEARGNTLYSQYQHAFPVAYREDFSPRHAVLDISLIEEALAGAPLALKLYKPLRKGSAGQNLKVFRAGQPVSLSASLPVLENMGVRVQDERPYAVERADGATVWINDFGLEVANVAHIEQDDVRERFQQLLRRVPDRYRVEAHHWLILHGRYVCTARSPNCRACRVRPVCDTGRALECP